MISSQEATCCNHGDSENALYCSGHSYKHLLMNVFFGWEVKSENNIYLVKGLRYENKRIAQCYGGIGESGGHGKFESIYGF